MHKKTWTNLVWAIAISALFSILNIVLFYTTDKFETLLSLKRIFVLFGGNILDGGYIQTITYIAFWWAFFEIRYKRRKIKYQNSSFRLKLLPTGEKHLLLAQDLSSIYDKSIEYEKKYHFLLIDLVKKACAKFRLTNSIAEVIEIISIQIDINKEKSESNLSHLRYLTWVIPSIGFIGTVLGISSALFVANSGDMNLITSKLGVAFDTTLISLVLSIVIMWFFHGLVEETDRLHAKLKEYIVDNLINRIEYKNQSL